MAHSYKFSVISFEPDQVRRERLNVGIIVFREDDIDVHITPRLEKLRAISHGVEARDLQVVADSLCNIDRSLKKGGILDPVQRANHLERVGPFRCGSLGTFNTDPNHSYSDTVAALLQKFVESEQGFRKARAPKRTKVGQQLKRRLQNASILAKPSEGLDSHRLVSNFEVAEGLVADLVLKNGAFHVIETVDASGDSGVLRRAISDVALSALVLERARMSFGAESTRSRMVYSASASLESHLKPSLDAAEHQGAELVNWSSKADQIRLLDQLLELATPSKGAQGIPRLALGTRTGIH